MAVFETNLPTRVVDCCGGCGKIKMPQSGEWVSSIDPRWTGYRNRLKKLFRDGIMFEFEKKICPECDNKKAA